ncbi:VOC family protein [Kribbella sp. DT2]|uniref:VOC family protein n=1 Tax=Kribbella sp. DT2 TaxID=3393427 RepID=UPI003CFA54FB
MVMTLRVEVFARDLEAAGEFYRRVLGFEELNRQPDYLWMGRGTARIGIGERSEVVDPAHRRMPSGTELVLEVDDLDAEYARVVASGWPVEGEPRVQQWGLRDFRLFDADGYYLRVTSRGRSAPDVL